MHIIYSNLKNIFLFDFIGCGCHDDHFLHCFFQDSYYSNRDYYEGTEDGDGFGDGFSYITDNNGDGESYGDGYEDGNGEVDYPFLIFEER